MASKCKPSLFDNLTLISLCCPRGNLCKASQDLRPSETEIVYSDVEKDVMEMEKLLGIQDVEFEVFERSIKRFGYCVDLTDDCWKAISQETQVEIAKLQDHNEIQHSFF